MADNRERINHWLAAKVPGASFNHSGIASIQRDQDTQIVLEISSSGELCHFCALISPLDEESPEASLFAALELNRFGKPLGGCWVAWEPDLQALTLCRNMELSGADEITFSNAIDNFIAALDSARRELIVHPEKADLPALAELA